MLFLPELLSAVFAYLLGSLSFAVIVSRVMGLPDPHSYGSGNPGATNVLRSGNKKAALFTLVGDTLKGVLAVCLAKYWVPQLGIGAAGIALVAMAVFLGHLFPIFFAFKGGKGVSTAAGVLWALDWRIGLVLTLVWGAVFAATRVSSLSAIFASLCAPLVAFYWFGMSAFFIASAAITLMLLLRHKTNIARLMKGEEGNFRKP